VVENIQPYKLESSIRLNEPLESFCFTQQDGRTLLLAANGNLITILEVTPEMQLEQLCTIHAFQKPIMKIVYYEERKRVIATGLDQ